MSCTNKNIGELIGSYELGLLSEEEKLRFESHLLECEYCFQSLYQAAPITDLVRKDKLAPSDKAELQDHESIVAPRTTSEKSRSFRFLGRKWAFAAASVLTVMIIAFVFVRLQGPGEKTERLRGDDDVSILVLSPVGEVSTLSELRWKPVAGVDSYEVRILTETGNLVWEGSAQETKAVLPDSINEALIQGPTYFWQVEAVTDKGESIKSQMVRFRIRK
jgi:hypothetical protein